MKNMYLIFTIVLIFILQGCGGGGGGGNSKTEVYKVTGTLLDSAISGVTYSCSGTTGLTNNLGQFTCPANSEVSFSIGGLLLGTRVLNSRPSQYITPATILGLAEDNITDQRLINFVRLVQSLDDNNNPYDGINITSNVRSILEGESLNIYNSSLVEDDLITLLSSVSKTIVSTNDALTHYKDTLVITLNIALNDDPLYSQQWTLAKNDEFYSENGINENANINASNVFLTYKGRDVNIAVIDDGLDTTHEDLSGAITYTYDFEAESTGVTQNNDDIHGTAVTGIIAARENSIGIKGIASSSNILFFKLNFPYQISDLIKMFNKADELGADIINCSWGTTSGVSDAVKDTIIDLATNGRNGKGIIIVFASGNDDDEIGDDEANIPEVISVGATNIFNLRTGYSNFGENLDIVAPGGEYWGITTLDPMGSAGVATVNENYNLYNAPGFVGTSASAPIVSGIVALMLEKNPSLTRDEVETLLRNTADKIGDETYINGRNDYYGYGKVNLTNLIENVPSI